MSKRERHKLASSFVEIETKFIDIPFRSVGSIYFKRDVPSGFQAPLHATGAQKDHDMSRFALAPLRIICFGMGKSWSRSLPWALCVSFTLIFWHPGSDHCRE